MAIEVRIPTILRTYTGGESEVTAAGATLAEVLDDPSDDIEKGYGYHSDGTHRQCDNDDI